MKNDLLDTLLGVLGLICAAGLLLFVPLCLVASLAADRSCAELFGGAAMTCGAGALVFLILHRRGELLGQWLAWWSRRRRASRPRFFLPPKASRLSVREHARARRCAYCHEDFAAGDVAHPCSGCRTWIHRDCWREALLCPSLGCRNARAR